MTKPLLRSGSKDDFCALGENGQSLFELAQQIRETLRLRKQHALFNSLAVPQLNETNNRVNWFAPQEGEVIPWAAASAEQQRAALAHLETCAAAIATLAQQFSQSQDATAQLFAALLPNIMRFPGSQFVYLVEGMPVITFWGFTPFGAEPEQEALAPLRAALKAEPEPEPAAEACAPLLPQREEEDEAIVVSLRQQPIADVATVAETAPTGRAPARMARWALTGAFFALCGALLFWPGWHALRRPGLTPLQAASPQSAAAPALPELNNIQLPLVASRLKLPATVVPPRAEAVPPPDALQLPADDVRTGSTRFFQGKWRLSPLEHASALPGIAGFRLTVGREESQAQLTTVSNAHCQASIKFGLMQSGNLVVKSYSRAKCSDGTRLAVPDVICNRNAEGITLCNADYGDGLPIAISVRKVKE
ncbi:hypothetical protein BBB56_02100 [Candidatus Pantoea deserta]|uniref:Uncharacterized protein n=1 Tax=Candidatus Pantoea deserta TaxID=1869313 RepID=A0A3N4PDY2_9GAMM|nr:SrfA family protein [Pantoea deserta]RPE04649.1 hypothetical protein BBB56_02100 [Pantoea deserta]